MSQRVESSRFPFLPLRLTVGDDVIEVEARIDTGFDGGIALPPELAASAMPVALEVYGLADESQVRAPLYRGIVGIGNLLAFRVDITALGDEPIAGQGVTDRFSVLLDHGRRVLLEP